MARTNGCTMAGLARDILTIALSLTVLTGCPIKSYNYRFLEDGKREKIKRLYCIKSKMLEVQISGLTFKGMMNRGFLELAISFKLNESANINFNPGAVAAYWNHEIMVSSVDSANMIYGDKHIRYTILFYRQYDNVNGTPTHPQGDTVELIFGAPIEFADSLWYLDTLRAIPPDF